MRRSATLFLAFVAAAALVAGAAGLSIMDGPQAARFKRLDAQRLQDLRALGNAIDAYKRKIHKLPESLDVLAQDSPLQRLKLQDPEQRSYVYRVKSETAYELCAHFDMAADENAAPYGFPGGAKHPAGDHCFGFTSGQAS